MNPTYHNPDNLPSPGEGWRFLVEGEEKQPGDEWYLLYHYTWIPICEDELTRSAITYRTRRPLPVATSPGEEKHDADEAHSTQKLEADLRRQLEEVQRERDEAKKRADFANDVEIPTWMDRADSYKKAIDAAVVERDALLTHAEALAGALKMAGQFISNGIEFGYIRMPDKDTPDPAHETPKIVAEALQAYRAHQSSQK